MWVRLPFFFILPMLQAIDYVDIYESKMVALESARVEKFRAREKPPCLRLYIG